MIGGADMSGLLSPRPWLCARAYGLGRVVERAVVSLSSRAKNSSAPEASSPKG